LFPAIFNQSKETQNKKELFMKRFHVHVSVDDLAASVRFYSTVFGVSPTVLKDDYANWMIDDPRVNFAISRRGTKSGLDHLGVQVESEAELTELRKQVAAAEIAALDQPNAECCYVRSDKYWTTDPQGIAWETFHTIESIPVYGDIGRAAPKACCAPAGANESQITKAGACCG
jgi:catechol 2,3-dioxygenase-like lactoylglutathione lyase family enzyme